MLGTGYCILDAGCRILDARFWKLDTGFSNFEIQFSDFKVDFYLVLGFRHCDCDCEQSEAGSKTRCLFYDTVCLEKDAPIKIGASFSHHN